MHAAIPRNLLALIALATLMSGCAQSQTRAVSGTTTAAAAAYLFFSGDTLNATVTVDNLTFVITEANAKNHFEVTPGGHRVKVEKQGRVVVDREIMLSDRQTLEVAIP